MRRNHARTLPFLTIFLLFSCIPTSVGDVSLPLPGSQTRRQLLYYRGGSGSSCGSVAVPPYLVFDNERQERAYIALQAWKQAIISDPRGLTLNWVGSIVCNYTGVFCSKAPDYPSMLTVSGIDLNHGDIAGYLPEELGLLTDLAFFHVNSNRLCGTIPKGFQQLKLLHELDLSNNRFAGKFPYPILGLQSLRYLDIRFNEFEGQIPEDLFEKKLDAIFLNHNRFDNKIPDNIGNSPASVIVLANNNFQGCLPMSVRGMSTTLREVILMNNGLMSCLPPEIGLLKNVTIFDVSFNKLMGKLPETIGEMTSLEILNVGHNMLSGVIPQSLCSLPNLKALHFDYNFFTGGPPECLDLKSLNERRNCMGDKEGQRSKLQCKVFLSKKVDCEAFGCLPIPCLPLPPPPRSISWPPQPATSMPSTPPSS